MINEVVVVSMRILGIESSCDETGVAIYDQQEGLLAHALFSQISMHEIFGGVVPEIASRDHIKRVIPLVRDVMAEANTTQKDIDGIAYTSGPGLMGALMVGASIAKSLGWAWQVPTLGIHHMEGHLLAPMLEHHPPRFPFIALLVSGGHTQLVQVEKMGQYQVLGESLDDAAGEAFDKTAKILGLSYPGGPAIAKIAENCTHQDRYHFPRPMVDRPGLDFSFSGLKTYVKNTVESFEGHMTARDKSDIAFAFQEAVVDTLLIKCRRAIKQTGVKTLVIAGGVSANQVLRKKLSEEMSKLQAELFYPRLEFCTDNGAMIAYVGCQRIAAGQHDNLEIHIKPRWPLSELSPVEYK